MNLRNENKNWHDTFDRIGSWPICSAFSEVLQCNRIGSQISFLSYHVRLSVTSTPNSSLAVSLCFNNKLIRFVFVRPFFQLYHVGYYARSPVFCLFDRFQCQIAVSWLTRYIVAHRLLPRFFYVCGCVWVTPTGCTVFCFIFIFLLVTEPCK